MDSEKIIIELKDLSKVYQMGEENIVKHWIISTWKSMKVNLSPSWDPPVQAKPL